jgi:glutaminase
MYDESGEWLATVGFAAKSGVAGGIMGALPGQVGIAAFSPKLDRHGNSTRSVNICRQLSADMGLHMMNSSQVALSSIQTSVATVLAGAHADEPHHPNCDREVVVFSLRGAVRFGGSEKLTRALEEELTGHHADACAVVLSFRETYSLNDIARRVIHEDVKRLLEDGRNVVAIDPSSVLQWDFNATENVQHPAVFATESEAREFIGGAGCRIATASAGW